MKILITIISLFTLMAVQAESISPKVMLEIESRIEIQKEALQEKLSNFSTDDITEGKIVASIVNTVESKLAQAQTDLDSIDSDEKLTVENIDAINKILDESEKLIEEI